MRIRTVGTATLLVLFAVASHARAGAGDFPKRYDLEKHGSHYYVNVPKGYFDDANAERKYPMIVGLHGAGDTAEKFCASFWKFAEAGYLICAVKSPGHAWSGSEDDLVFASMDAVKKEFRVDPKHVSLAGFSSGSFFGMPLVFRKPKPFNALLAMGGGTPVGVKSEAMRLHVFLIVGEQDPVKGTLESAFKQLEKKKMDVTLRIVPGIGHVYPPPEEMAKVLKWFGGFSPWGMKTKDLEKRLEKARVFLKRKRFGSAIPHLKEIASSGIESEVVEEAKEELEKLRDEVMKEVDKAHVLAEGGNPRGARSLLLAVARKYKGLKEADDAKVMADAME